MVGQGDSRKMSLPAAQSRISSAPREWRTGGHADAYFGEIFVLGNYMFLSRVAVRYGGDGERP